MLFMGESLMEFRQVSWGSGRREEGAGSHSRLATSTCSLPTLDASSYPLLRNFPGSPTTGKHSLNQSSESCHEQVAH